MELRRILGDIYYKFFKKKRPSGSIITTEIGRRIVNRINVFKLDKIHPLPLLTFENGIDDLVKQDLWQTILDNKINSRRFAEYFGCKVPHLYGIFSKDETFDFKTLPDVFVIRPSYGHSASGVYLMKNGLNLFDNKNYTVAEIEQNLKAALNTNPDIQFLIEEFVADEQGQIKMQTDYKFYMFNGHIAYIWVVDRISSSKGITGFYDENWKPLKLINDYYATTDKIQPRPKCMDEMIAQAKTLSKAYQIFVRVDFYATDKGAVFGEFTPTPYAGKRFTEYGDQLLCSYWDKYCKGMV